MLSTSGAELDAALAELGWADMLSDMPDLAIPLVFRLLGETGSHASVLNDVVLQTIGRVLGGTPPMPYAGGGWVVWDTPERADNSALGGLPLRRVHDGGRCGWPMPAGRVGWWLVGSARAMLTLARQHALDRVQFGKPIASFQAVRHRLAETLVAIEGAEATLSLPGDGQPRSDRAAGQGRRGQGRADRGQTLPAGARRHRLHRRTRSAPPREAGRWCSTDCSAAQGNSRGRPGRGCGPAVRHRAWPSCKASWAHAQAGERKSTRHADKTGTFASAREKKPYLMLAFISSRFTSTGHPLTLNAFPWPV